MRKKLLSFCLAICMTIACFTSFGSLPSNFMGYVVNGYEPFNSNIVGFSLPTGKTSMSAIYPFAGTGITFKCGTWVNDKYVGIWASGDEENPIYSYRFFYPNSGEWKDLGVISKFLPRHRIFNLAYDPISKKVYTVINDSLYSNNLDDATFTVIGNLTGNIMPKAIACNKAGNLFVICQENSTSTSNTNLFSIDKTNATTTLVASLEKQIYPYSSQSATFDYNTDKLYYQCAQGTYGSEYKFLEINTTTGATTEITDMNGIVISGLSSMYYTQNTPPAKITELTTAIDNVNHNQINISFKTPTLDMNGALLSSPIKAVVYLKNLLTGKFEAIDTINPVSTGVSLEKQYNVTGEGLYIYAIAILSENNATSGLVQSAIHNITAVTPPYTNDFSSSNSNIIVNTSDEGSIIISTNNGTDNSQCYAFAQKGGVNNKLSVMPIILKKGYTYNLSFNIRSTSSSYFYYSINNEKEKYVNTSKTFTKFETTYLATQDYPEAIFSFYKQSSTDTIFFDNIEISIAAADSVPAKTTFTNVSAAPLGEMKALVQITTPDKDMLGNVLSNLSGVKIEYSTSYNFNSAPYQNYGIEDFPITLLAKDTVLEVPITSTSIPNTFYFRAFAYNSFGRSYEITLAPKGIFIGNDEPKAPSNLKLTNTADGKILVQWDSVKAGRNNGYVNKDEIKYTLSYSGMQTPGSNTNTIINITDTSYEINSLPLGVYSVRVKAHFKTKASSEVSSYTIIKAKPNQKIIVNADRQGYAGSYDIPFSTYAGANNNVSGLTQMTYSTTEMGGAMYIDTLHFFAIANSNRNNKFAYKIAMGYKENVTFANNKDFVNNDQLQIVFDDTVYFDSITSRVSIPIKGFYYDGTKPLLIQFTKSLFDKTSIDVYTMQTPSQYRSIISKSYTEEYTNITSPTVYPNTSYFTSVPAFAVSRNIILSSISGSVKDKITGLPINNAVVSIVSVAGENENPLNVKITTDVSGNYNFNILPLNNYTITISADGYKDSLTNININLVTPYIHSVDLETANQININGTITNANDDLIDGVAVKISSDFITETTTASNGAFTFNNLYGSTKYTLTFTKEGMETVVKTYTLGDTNTTLEPVVLNYIPVAVPLVIASINENGKGIVKWNKSNPEATNGYRVYRGTYEQTFDAYTELTSNAITDTNFTDESLNDVEFGIFKYAVVTDWYANIVSVPTYSDTIEKNMNITLDVIVKTNGASPIGAALKLSNNINTTNILYDTVKESSGLVSIGNVRRGNTYKLDISLNYHKSVTMNDIVAPSATIESDTLVELIAKPAITESNALENTIEIKWSIANTVNPIEFKLYINDTLKGTVPASTLEYTYTNLRAGTLVAGIKAVFASGESEMVTKSIEVEGFPAPYNLNVNVTNNNAVFTWSPGGLSNPKHYEVYLNDELKNDNVAATTFNFNNLPVGDYTASVIAVFENGKSEKASKTFNISYSNINELSTDNIIVYPNPTVNGKVYINNTNTFNYIKVYDIKGKLILDSYLPYNETFELNLSNYPKGIYLLNFIGKEKSKTIKLINN